MPDQQFQRWQDAPPNPALWNDPRGNYYGGVPYGRDPNPLQVPSFRQGINDPNRANLLSNVIQAGGMETGTGPQTIDWMLRRFGFDTTGKLTGIGKMATPLAGSNLIELLLNQGRTDPAMMNRTLSDIGRGTQQQQNQLRGQLAATGNQGSGVGQAINAAIGVAGQDQRAGVLAQDAQMAEDRRRNDLQLFNQMIVDPALVGAGIERGVSTQRAALDMQRRGQDLAGIGGLTSTIGLGLFK